MPGFRPGKAPKDMVLKKYEKEITEEVKKKLISDTFRQGVKDQKIDVVGVPGRGGNSVCSRTKSSIRSYR